MIGRHTADSVAARTGTDYALELRDTSRVHGEGPTTVEALRDVSLGVEPGELVAVMGPSGSGKSTLLHLAGGLDQPTSGSVHVEGITLGGLSRTALAAVRRRSIGYVFQDLNLIPALTAAENVALPRELDGVRTRAVRAEAIAALDEIGVPELADEPTGALDTVTGEEVLGVLRALGRAYDVADRHGYNLRAEQGPRSMQMGFIPLAAGAALVTLVGVGVVVSLAAAEGRADLATMAAVGASPRRRRAIAAWQALFVAGLGSVLGLALGTYYGYLTYPATGAPEFAVPWLTIATIGVGVPLLAALVAMAFTRSRLPMVRRIE